MRLLVLLAVILGLGATVLYLDYGTVQPCGILRERMRRQEMREGGQVGRFLASTMPDRVLDGLMAAQYGPLSPGRCIDLLFKGAPSERPGSGRRPSD